MEERHGGEHLRVERYHTHWAGPTQGLHHCLSRLLCGSAQTKTHCAVRRHIIHAQDTELQSLAYVDIAQKKVHLPSGLEIQPIHHSLWLRVVDCDSSTTTVGRINPSY